MFFLSVPVLAQECDLSITGHVRDTRTGEAIAYATVFLEEARRGTVSDSSGFFQIESVCTDEYHMVVSHVGCETKQRYFRLMRDTVLAITLEHNRRFLDEVSVTGDAIENTTQAVQSLGEEAISKNANQNLGNMLETVAGVSTIRNGNSIAKPVVHGLYGNRLTILNNGIAQSGQQWGLDHSPEIDPLAANRISVVKGVSALEYPGNSLGSVVRVDPAPIRKEPHLHGKGNLFLESNGRGGGVNLQLQRYRRLFAWRVEGTLKKSGDKHTPDYYLQNTGSEEANLAVQLEKSFTEHWHNTLYFSSFNTQIGILRGSHIGNLTDLEAALTREVPFFTNDQFSYDIEAPYQRVNHHLLKFHSKYLIGDDRRIDVTYAGQLDYRKEFDVRRSGRTDDPALSLRQSSHFLEGKYEHFWTDGWHLKTGAQVNRIDNTNVPETGILPLIPDYVSYESGVFALVSWEQGKVAWEGGGRYDYVSQNVAAISTSVPREVIRYENDFHNVGAATGLSYALSSAVKLVGNLGYAARNPEVNELYSNGLHQGVSGIEEGDPDLTKETSLKTTFSVEGKIRSRLLFNTLVYYQSIQDYIFLNPQDEVRLTIRGAFPVFRYEQTDARIYGFDVAATYQMIEPFSLVLKYSHIQGDDLDNNVPLIYLPSNNLYAALNYQVPELGYFRNCELEVNHRTVFEQRDLEPEQDFIAPPGTYHLLGMRASAERQIDKVRLNVYAKVDNLLNVAYRDYLNRQRYFADDWGINVTLGASVSF